MRGRLSPVETVGVVRSFDLEEGWGVLDSPDVPGGCFVHYSDVDEPRHGELRPGQRVRFKFEQPGFLQDGYEYRAHWVRIIEW